MILSNLIKISLLLYNYFTFKFLMIKAKYYVVEPYYMEDSTPEQLPQNVDDPTKGIKLCSNIFNKS